MIYEHHLCHDKGKLIKARDHGRNREESLDKFEQRAVFMLGESYRPFLMDVRKSKPRYFRDQLSLMEAILADYPLQTVHDAIEYCQGLALNSFNDVRNACKFMASIKPKLNAETINKLSVKPITNPQVMNITIQRRDINEYSLVGGDHYE